MLSKNQLKFLKSLHLKKYRKQHQAFLVEGEKSLQEILQSDWQVEKVYCTDRFFNTHMALLEAKDTDYQLVTPEELTQAGTFMNNYTGLAVAKIPANKPFSPPENGYTIVLDAIQDPGNLGTIIRIADWYGFPQIVCSQDTVDLFNPKTIAASMASFLRVDLYYCDLSVYFSQHNVPVFGAVLQGENIHKIQFPSQGFILLGNEANGIRKDLLPLIEHSVTIPQFGQAESLNVSIATAVICDNVRRQR